VQDRRRGRTQGTSKKVKKKRRKTGRGENNGCNQGNCASRGGTLTDSSLRGVYDSWSCHLRAVNAPLESVGNPQPGGRRGGSMGGWMGGCKPAPGPSLDEKKKVAQVTRRLHENHPFRLSGQGKTASKKKKTCVKGGRQTGGAKGRKRRLFDRGGGLMALFDSSFPDREQRT